MLVKQQDRAQDIIEYTGQPVSATMATELMACTEAESHGLSLTVRRSSNHLTQSLVYPCTPSRKGQCAKHLVGQFIIRSQPPIRPDPGQQSGQLTEAVIRDARLV
jgi:hypothetical protein